MSQGDILLSLRGKVPVVFLVPNTQSLVTTELSGECLSVPPGPFSSPHRWWPTAKKHIQLIWHPHLLSPPQAEDSKIYNSRNCQEKKNLNDLQQLDQVWKGWKINDSLWCKILIFTCKHQDCVWSSSRTDYLSNLSKSWSLLDIGNWWSPPAEARILLAESSYEAAAVDWLNHQFE